MIAEAVISSLSTLVKVFTRTPSALLSFGANLPGIALEVGRLFVIIVGNADHTLLSPLPSS